MPLLRTTCLTLALSLALATVSFAQMQPTTTRTFPSVTGSNLEGRRFELPRDFEGALNVVAVAFQREQQDDVDSWMPALRALAAKDARVRVYELPTLGRGLRLVRPMIDGGMRRGIPDRSVREATITLYIDKGAFKRALGITSENAIQLFLVDRAGAVLWHGEGWFSASGLADLERHLPAATGDAGAKE